MSSKYDSFSNAFWLITNVAAVVGIVSANKLVFSRFNFHFGTLLTVIHFAFTSLCLEVAKGIGLVERKSNVKWWKVLPLSVAFCGFVVLTNLSLQYNSVGFYQMAKVMTTPIMAIIQFVFYNKKFSRGILACLTVVCIGVSLATVTEMKLTLIGFNMALAACFVTAIYSIWVETEQKRLGLNAMQLLSYQAPLSALILVGFVPVFDNYKEILNYKMSLSAGVAISTSAFLAFLVNISTFIIIGKMSAITYNVAGHIKLCFILAAGYLLFDNKFNWLNMIGVGLAVSGVVTYSMIKMKLSKPFSSIKPDKNIIGGYDSLHLNPIIVSEAKNEDLPKRSLLIYNNESVFIGTGNKINPN